MDVAVQALRSAVLREADHMVREINGVLLEAGIVHPVGARGVRDLLRQRNVQIDRAHEAEQKLAATARLHHPMQTHRGTVCVECTGQSWPCNTAVALGVP